MRTSMYANTLNGKNIQPLVEGKYGCKMKRYTSHSLGETGFSRIGRNSIVKLNKSRNRRGHEMDEFFVYRTNQ